MLVHNASQDSTDSNTVNKGIDLPTSPIYGPLPQAEKTSDKVEPSDTISYRHSMIYYPAWPAISADEQD